MTSAQLARIHTAPRHEIPETILSVQPIKDFFIHPSSFHPLDTLHRPGRVFNMHGTFTKTMGQSFLLTLGRSARPAEGADIQDNL